MTTRASKRHRCKDALHCVDGGGYHTTLTVFTDPIQSFSLSPLGQSADPASPHYSDLARLLSERRLKPTLFDKAAILREQTSAVTLEFARPVPPR